MYWRIFFNHGLSYAYLQQMNYSLNVRRAEQYAIKYRAQFAYSGGRSATLCLKAGKVHK